MATGLDYIMMALYLGIQPSEVERLPASTLNAMKAWVEVNKDALLKLKGGIFG